MALTEHQKKDKQGHPIQCIRNDGKLGMEIQLNCLEFSWNCPAVQQPDFGTILITYTPSSRIIETKSLKFYLQTYRYRNAFAEELATRITLDILYYVVPKKVEVKLLQNSRGGIANTVAVGWDDRVETDVSMWQKLNYTPKKDFRGGWPMLFSETDVTQE